MILSVFIFIFGAMIGSFLNVLIYRLPKEMNWVSKRSHCPNCNIQIPFYRNIPIITFILQLGKCHHCKSKIGFTYPFVELLTAIVGLLLFPKHINLDNLLFYSFYFSIFCVFLVHFIIDVRHQILPDELNLYLFCIFAFYGFFKLNIFEVIIGGIIGFGFPYLVAYLFYKFKGIEGLGGGDIKLYGALGLFLGPQGIMQNIFMSCLFGSVIGIILILAKIIKKNKPIPFGPFIILSATIQIFFPLYNKAITDLIGF